MNKNVIIGVIVIVLVLLGIWYFASMNGSAPAQDMSATTSSSSSTSATGSVPASTNTFRSIFTQSGNHECTYELVGTSTRSSSVVYIADGKMRGEFRTTGTVTSANFMIYSGGVLYTWKEGATVGKKTSISSLADLPQAIPQDLTSAAILGVSNDNVSWDCRYWAKNATVFTIPSYVNFSAGA